MLWDAIQLGMGEGGVGVWNAGMQQNGTRRKFLLDRDGVGGYDSVMIDRDDETKGAGKPEGWMEACENAPLTPMRVILKRRGYEPVRPGEVAGGEVRGRVWELVYALAGHRCFLDYTDHMTDEAFYAYLCEWIDEDVEDVPLRYGVNLHQDCSAELDEDLEDEMDDENWDPFAAELGRSGDEAADRDRFMPQPAWPAPAAGEGDEDSEDEGMGAGAEEVERGLPTMEIPRPGSAGERGCGAVLWELLHHLAIRGWFVTGTNHLRDEELYGVLWREVLGGEGKLPRTRHGKRYRLVRLGGEGQGEVVVRRDWRLPRPPY